MGSCCVSNSTLIGEQFIRDILSDESFKLRKYTYMELLNEIVSKRVEQEIPKEHVKQFLFPEFYDGDKSDSNEIYINSIFNYIMEHLEEKNNMYLVLLYFYPFINHEKEDKADKFFSIIRFITQSHKLEISRENVRQWLFQYISFCTWGVTYAIRIKMPPADDLNNSIKLLLKGPFSEDKLNNFLDKMMNTLTNRIPEEVIKLDMFKKLFEKYDLSNIENIRDFLLAEKEGK
jgi:hypothetical protein